MADAGVNQYTFHIEPVNDVERVCRKIKENGMKVCKTRMICCTYHNDNSKIYLEYYLLQYYICMVIIIRYHIFVYVYL